MTAMLTLRFECQKGCTACCETKGYVYLSDADVGKAAAFLGMTQKAFEKKYVYRTRNHIRLRKPPEKQCPFLESWGCSIHPAKPTQCRLFPFWPELVERRASWEAAGVRCPGIGKGELIQIGTAVDVANEMRTAYPAQYRSK